MGGVTRDNSTAEIDNSNMTATIVCENSTTSIKNSVLELLETGPDPPDRTTINIAASKIDHLNAFGATKICVEDSTVTHMNAHSNADLLFVDWHVGRFETHGNPKVVVGWNLPLFGLVKMPHTWIPFVQMTIVVAIGAYIFIVLRILMRRRARMQETRKGHEKKLKELIQAKITRMHATEAASSCGYLGYIGGVFQEKPTTRNCPKQNAGWEIFKSSYVCTHVFK